MVRSDGLFEVEKRVLVWYLYQNANSQRLVPDLFEPDKMDVWLRECYLSCINDLVSSKFKYYLTLHRFITNNPAASQPPISRFQISPLICLSSSWVNLNLLS